MTTTDPTDVPELHTRPDRMYPELPDEVGDDDERRPWRIGDPTKNGEPFDAADAATWQLRKLAAVNAERAHLADQHDREEQRLLAEVQPQLDALADWLADRMAAVDKAEQRAKGLLADWQHRRRAEDGTKSISLPSGELTSRQGAAKVVVDDELLLAKQLREMGRSDLLKVTITVPTVELRKACQVDSDGTTMRIDGERIEHAHLDEGTVTYQQKPITVEPAVES